MTCKFSRSFLHIWELPFQIESNSQKGKFTLKYPYHPFRVTYRSPQISLANEKALIKLSSNSPLDISCFVITILKEPKRASKIGFMLKSSAGPLPPPRSPSSLSSEGWDRSQTGGRCALTHLKISFFYIQNGLQRWCIESKIWIYI